MTEATCPVCGLPLSRKRQARSGTTCLESAVSMACLLRGFRRRMTESGWSRAGHQARHLRARRLPLVFVPHGPGFSVQYGQTVALKAIRSGAVGRDNPEIPPNLPPPPDLTDLYEQLDRLVAFRELKG